MNVLTWQIKRACLVGVFDAAAVAVVVFAPALVPHVVALLAPLVCKLVGAPQAPVLLPPPLLPLLPLHISQSK